MNTIHIGWPEGIMLALLFITLSTHAVKDGQLKEEPYNRYSFPVALVRVTLWLTLLYLGGFFA